MKKSLIMFSLLAIVLFFTSCLTVEKKIFTYEFTGKNSGKLTIKYVNIMSTEGDSIDKINADFDELMNDYISGDKIQSDYPEATNITKRLFEENGVLCGEVTMDFNDLRAVKLFQLDSKSPYMLSLSSFTEQYLESNGIHGGDIMPVVFWKKGTKKLTLTTSVATPDDKSISLLSLYKNLKK